jgi:hypothetical protein
MRILSLANGQKTLCPLRERVVLLVEHADNPIDCGYVQTRDGMKAFQRIEHAIR